VFPSLVVTEELGGYDRRLIMAIPLKVRKIIEKNDWEALEDAWLEHLDSDSLDLGYFTGIANYLASNGEPERAESLLELLNDELEASSRWHLRLQLLIDAGSILYSAADLHQELLACLRKKFAEQSSLEGLMEYVGLHRAVEDIPKTIKKVGVLQSLLTYEAGSVVGMKGKGAGVVQEVNFELESFKIQFEGESPLMVRFKAAPKLMIAVAKEHFFYRKIRDPESLQAIGEDSPGDLLGALLSSFDSPCGAGQIREMLGGLVEDSKWASWWTAARKHPQILTSGKGGRQVYSWADSAGDALDQVRENFDNADPLRKLEIYLTNRDREAAAQEYMSSELNSLGERLAPNEPGISLEIWLALEKASALRSDNQAWSAQNLLQDAKRPEDIVFHLKKNLSVSASIRSFATVSQIGKMF
jgi:transcription elongation factor GreA-like protein